MPNRIEVAGLNVSHCLFNFIEQDVLPNLPISSADFWTKFSCIISELSPINKALLEKREELQRAISHWHQQPENCVSDIPIYKKFLNDIGYIAPMVNDFTITTTGVDPELATMAGPQLVVPITNARFALNAVNARWGSLYDALYGTDVIEEESGAEKSISYNPVRGQKVIQYGRQFLDNSIPLSTGSHQQAIQYRFVNEELEITLADERKTKLKDPSQLIGYKGSRSKPICLLFEHYGLRFELNFNDNSDIASRDLAGVSDITIESALTTIMDCEDSVATVDSEDKVVAYRNWLGLNQGTLTTKVTKNNQRFVRAMSHDRSYMDLHDQTLILPGRSLMFVRNVGHLMTNDAIVTSDGQAVFEGIMDAMVTSLISLHDILKLNQRPNSREGSIYIVKPKMHGPDEVAFANLLFSRVEQALCLPENTIKMGIMDEERRTSINLKACIYQAKDRVVFINTGFLDRTGDEIHTSMEAGIMERKSDIKHTAWIKAYENHNVDIGLACGFSGKAQIGKGMWPIPDNMADMMSSKIDHVNAGANTAWVPSPTAATLHALHYHHVDVFLLQKEIRKRKAANIDTMLQIPLVENPQWTTEQIRNELDNNIQGILGYVVKWINSGIGCSKVLDINNTGLMEDRATLRISSQHIANWLKHGICHKQDVEQSLKKMAMVVDKQNAHDVTYTPMSDNLSLSLAFQAAHSLIFCAEEQPNGYTEPLLHAFRAELKLSGPFRKEKDAIPA